jgi:phosphoglycerol transferase MdoB-like AlkP superfamily enzyme
MTAFVLAWALAMAGAVAAERLTWPRSPWLASDVRMGLFRLAVLTLLFASFFALSWRPFYAAAATVIFAAVFVAISWGKHRYTYEPLVFSDIVFLDDIFRHATLFHTTFLGPAFVAVAVAVIAAFTGFWWSLEPPLAAPRAWLWALLGACLVTVALPFLPVTRRALERAALEAKSEPDVFRDLGDAGLLATLAIDWLSWRGEDRHRRIAAAPPPAPPIVARGAPGADLVIAVQAEAFMDFRRFHEVAPALPNLDSARSRSLAWGRLGSAFAGGYTMRTEVSLLTGLPHRALGYDRYFPYLNAGAYAEVALPARLRALGYSATFVHPFHASFFRRHRAMPALGFERMIMLGEFREAERVGEYVSDRAVAERVIREAKAAPSPAFIFAATMENHEPWGVGRFAGVSDPVQVYGRHLVNADAMLGMLVSMLDDWPGRAVLAFYGDHVPLLKTFADPFPDSDTDYVLLELGRDSGHSPRAGECRLEVHELAHNLLAAAGMNGDGQAVAKPIRAATGSDRSPDRSK